VGLLRYTGHFFVDIGVATLTVMSNRARPEDVTIDDLEMAGQQLKADYCELKPLRNYLSTIFLNSPFVQAAMTAQDRLDYADEVLFAFHPARPTFDGVACVFFPELTAVLYAHRQHIPLLNGRGIANFSASGSTGIPVSGVALLAIHAMPLGCMKCGLLLGFHQIRSVNSHAPDMTATLAALAYIANRKAIAAMRQGVPDSEMPSLGSFKKTRYVEALLGAQLRLKQQRGVDLYNITGYYFSNYGPSPSLEFVRLDNNVVDFINEARLDAGDAWRRLTYQRWQAPKGEEKATPTEATTGTWRNSLYEDLFLIGERPRLFLRRHLGSENAAQLIDWPLISIFLGRIMLMEPERIETYKVLGDRLDAYMQKFDRDAKGFYYKFSRADKHFKLLAVLKEAAEKVMKAGEPYPLFTYDEFVNAFERPTNGKYADWRLGRDLISIRMLELMHQRKEELPELPASPEDENDDPDE